MQSDSKKRDTFHLLIFCATICALVFIAFLTMTSVGKAEDRKKVLSVALFDGCPFICLDESGPFVDGLKAAFAGAGYELQFKQIPFARAVKDLQTGHLDILPGVLKDGIDGAVFPSSWLYFTRMCFFSDSGDAWEWRGVTSLKERLIAIEKGIVHTPEFFNYVQNRQNVTHLSGNDILFRQLRMLKLGRIQSFTAEQTVLAHYLDQKGIAADSVKNAGCFEPEFEYAAISATHPEAADIQKILTVGLADYNRSIVPGLF